jgi:hypothetical protein
VIFAGHGANVVNNPFASGLHCGACGGYSGEVNARLLAGLLNVPDVRAGREGRAGSRSPRTRISWPVCTTPPPTRSSFTTPISLPRPMPRI